MLIDTADRFKTDATVSHIYQQDLHDNCFQICDLILNSHYQKTTQHFDQRLKYIPAIIIKKSCYKI